MKAVVWQNLGAPSGATDTSALKAPNAGARLTITSRGTATWPATVRVFLLVFNISRILISEAAIHLLITARSIEATTTVTVEVLAVHRRSLTRVT